MAYGGATESGGGTIQVTPEMVEAGRAELFESFALAGDYSDLVAQIFIAMAYASPQLSRLLPRSSGVLEKLRP